MPDLETLTPAARKAALGYEHNFARVLRIGERRVEFGYDLDRQRWPWLALSPLHPVVIDKIQYFSAVTASLTTERMVPGTRTALTKLSWSCRARAGGTLHATRGVFESWASERRGGYTLAIFDDAGHENARIRGEGRAFADRDFAGWRAQAKRRVAATAAEATPPPADPEDAGLGAAGLCFVSPPAGVSSATLLVARVGGANAFHPAHPFHTGTGDHVNAAHLFDCALQAAHLVWEPARTALCCSGGEAEFLRFVELDAPFEIELRERRVRDAGRRRLGFSIRQAGRENARIALELEPSAT
jgi:hypothetical protein